jgi:PPP family 3-phenylpropionic acid transporter
MRRTHLNNVRLFPSARRLNYHYFMMQIGFFAMLAAICGYQATLLQSRGFSNAQIGAVISVRCVAGILCQPAMGGFADRHPEIPLKLIVSLSLFVSLCAGIALIFIPMGLCGVVAVFFMLGGFEISVYPFVDSMAIQYINAGVPIQYSLGRGIGSFSYAVMAILLGLIVGRRGVEATLPIHAGLVVAEIAIIALYPTFCNPPRHENDEKPSPQSVFSLLRTNPKFTLMLIALFFGITGIVPMSNFLINVIKSRGGTDSSLGFALFLMAASELPIAFFFPRLLRRFGSTRLLLISLCFIILKSVFTLLSGSMAILLPIQLLQMVSYGLFTPSSVFFVNESVPEADRVRGQSLMMAATNGMGGVVGNLLAGGVLDLGGVNAMLIFCTVCGCAGTLLGWLASRMGRTV